MSLGLLKLPRGCKHELKVNSMGIVYNDQVEGGRGVLGSGSGM